MICRSAIALLFLALFASAARAQVVVYRAMTPEQLEKVLKVATISFQKHADAKPSTFVYDYQAKQFNLRLYYLGGQQLMLDTLFAAIPLEKINEWNLGARISRAALGKDEKDGAFTVLEARLSIKGGVTQNAIHEFLNSFVEELDQYQSFVGTAPRQDTAKEELTVTEVSAGLLEKALTDLNLKFTKIAVVKGGFKYDYQTKEAAISVTNWGKDMMLEAKFAKLSLENVNQYNLERKFVRAVAYDGKNGGYTGFEANLSFAGGVSPGIIRNYIAVFEEDAREFAEYVKKNGKQ